MPESLEVIITISFVNVCCYCLPLCLFVFFYVWFPSVYPSHSITVFAILLTINTKLTIKDFHTSLLIGLLFQKKKNKQQRLTHRNFFRGLLLSCIQSIRYDTVQFSKIRSNQLWVFLSLNFWKCNFFSFVFSHKII